MANAFVQPDVNLNAFSPSAQTSQMLAGKTGTPFDALNSLLAGQYRLQQEQAVANQNAAAKAAAAAKATTQQEFDNKIKTDTLAAAQGKVGKDKDLSAVAAFVDPTGNLVSGRYGAGGRPQRLNPETNEWDVDYNLQPAPKSEAGSQARVDRVKNTSKVKKQDEFGKRGLGVQSFIQKIDNLSDIAVNNEGAFTLIGTGAEFVQGVKTNLAALSKQLGKEGKDNTFSPKAINDTLALSTVSAQAKSQILTLVRDYAVAKGETLGKFTDRDAKDYTNMLLANWGNVPAIKQILADKRNEVITDYNNEKDYLVRTGVLEEGSPYSQNFGEKTPTNGDAAKRARLEELRRKKQQQGNL